MSGKRAKQERQAARAQLAALYAGLPSVECRGDCWESACGPIRFGAVEADAMRRAHGGPLPDAGDNLMCPLLGTDHRCTIYDARPLLCRLVGATEVMPCEHGCPVTGQPVGLAEGRELLIRVGARAADGQHAVTGLTLHPAWWERNGRRIERKTGLTLAHAKDGDTVPVDMDAVMPAGAPPS